MPGRSERVGEQAKHTMKATGHPEELWLGRCEPDAERGKK
jgi:hypothetical protein